MSREDYDYKEHYPMGVDNLGRMDIDGERRWVSEEERDLIFFRKPYNDTYDNSFGSLREPRYFGDD